MKRDFHAPGRSPVYGTNGMAATSMPIATLTALDILRAGGNAVDAALAASAVLAVVEPQSTGIGGDCFCLYAPARTGKVIALNGSGKAPMATTAEILCSEGLNQIPPNSAHAVTVPGAISAWALLSERCGRFGLDKILQPAIRYAEKGWPVHARVALDWATAAGRLNDSTTARQKYLIDGRPLAAGDNFIQPALGKTLRQVAAKGPSAFYEGAIAADMIETLRRLGGLHTEGDFAEGIVSAEFVQPISSKWRGMEIFECPPNGSGLLALMLLGILEGFKTPADGPLSATRLHRHVEAARLVYRDRDAFLADPFHVDVPVEHLTSPRYLAELRAAISDTCSMPVLPPAGASLLLPSHKDTVYLCVVDRDGNACSFINSLFASFGSCIYAEKSGVLFHNRGSSFRLEKGHPNCVAPGKRPMHTIIPGMVMKDGHPLMPFGVMGGHFQPMGQSLFLTNHFEFGLDIQEALDLPRLFPRDGKLEVEHGIPSASLARLVALGHQCEQVRNPHGGGQAIFIDQDRGWFVGGSDPRKDGCALGY